MDAYLYHNDKDFRRGDIVKVIEQGKTYTTHDIAFKKLGFKNTEENEMFTNGTLGRIFKTAKLPTGRIVFALEDVVGNQCLIEKGGIELANEGGKNIFKANSFARYYGVTSESLRKALMVEEPIVKINMQKDPLAVKQLPIRKKRK